MKHLFVPISTNSDLNLPLKILSVCTCEFIQKWFFFNREYAPFQVLII